jgi:hypothetical protein
VDDTGTERAQKKSRRPYLQGGAILIAGTMILAICRAAGTTAQFALQTRRPCAQSHQNPTDGTLTPIGEKVRANMNCRKMETSCRNKDQL